jgi:hypothetical protein
MAGVFHEDNCQIHTPTKNAHSDVVASGECKSGSIKIKIKIFPTSE